MRPSAENDAPHKQCGMCSSLSDQEYAFQKCGCEKGNSYLPAAADHLKVVQDFQPYDSRKLQVRQCSECGTYYLYRTDYEYFFNGNEDEEYLTRLTKEQAVEYLNRPAPA